MEVDKASIGRGEEVKISQDACAWWSGKGCMLIGGLNGGSVERMDEAWAVKGVGLTEEEMRCVEEPCVPEAVVRHV